MIFSHSRRSHIAPHVSTFLIRAIAVSSGLAFTLGCAHASVAQTADHIADHMPEQSGEHTKDASASAPAAFQNETQNLITESTVANETVPSGLIQIPISSNFYSPYAFVVDKQARQLTVWQQTPGGLKSIAAFPADLGKNAGEKKANGDRKTPEGIYFLQERLEAGAIDFNLYGKRAFTTDYPNFFDRLDGKTGNGIWLHAVPDKVALTRGSRGCVVVRNEVILGLTQYVKLGRTPILIQNQGDQINAKEASKITSELNQWVDSWRAAWETKNIASYIEHYSTDFRSNRMNRAQWQSYKNRLAKSYKTIGVRLSKPAIYADKNHAIVRFIQEYSSDLHSDLGEKTLYLKREPEGFRIVGEIWSEESSRLAHEEVEANKGMTTVGCGTDSGGDCLKTSANHD